MAFGPCFGVATIGPSGWTGVSGKTASQCSASATRVAAAITVQSRCRLASPHYSAGGS